MELLIEVDGLLHEAPVWDVRVDSLHLVDMQRPALHRLDWAGGSLSTTVRPVGVSVVLPTRHGMLVAERTEIVLETPGDEARSSPDGPWSDPDVRFNDAAVDPAGRLWIGTMADDARSGAGELWRVDPDQTWTRVMDAVSISNGLAWSPDGSLLYYTDSATRRVDVLDHDLASGAVTRRRPLVDGSGLSGMPDGLTVDADGCLWVAFYRSGAIRRFAPDGSLLSEVPVPVPRPTSLCFAGPALDTLVVTVRAEKHRGAHLYAHVPPTGGLPQAVFAGSAAGRQEGAARRGPPAARGRPRARGFVGRTAAHHIIRPRAAAAGARDVRRDPGRGDRAVPTQ